MPRVYGPDLTVERLRELVTYDLDTGEFVRRKRMGRHAAGTVAGSEVEGYIVLGIDNRQYSAHRLAFLYVNGSWPAEIVDHENGNTRDNRWGNLRECNSSGNSQNIGEKRAGKDLPIGVSWDRACGRFKARITIDGQQKCLGYFDSSEDARAAYLKAKTVVHTFQPTPRPNPVPGI